MAFPDELLRLIAQRTNDVYWVTDEHGVLRDVAPQIRDLIGRRPEDLIGRRVRDFVHHDDVEEVAALRATFQDKGNATFTYRLRRGDDYVWVDAVEHRSGSTVVGVWRDATERRRIEEAFEHQAYHDQLTNLPNRRLLDDRLTIALAQSRRFHSRLAVLLIALDRFSHLNDTLGEEIGDAVLRETASRLRSRLRAVDTLARVGPDVFAVVLSHLQHEEDAIRVAQTLLQHVRERIVAGDHELFVTASVGISLCPHDGESAAALFTAADEALHEAQNTANTWHLHESSASARALERLATEMDLHRALQRREFVVRYQPLMRVRDSGLVAVEALVRWQHPVRGELAPASFLDVAEERGLMIPIGEQVLDAVCAQAKHWLEAGWDNVSIATNLSARQFESDELLSLLDATADRHSIPPNVLQMEITESTALRDLTRGARILRGLRDRGVRVAIDDFGIGYSSLAYLNELAVDALKIDRAFLTAVPAGRQAAIIPAIISMGHALGLTVIAEGVEREDQMQFLRDHDCDMCQGYLFSRPTTAAEIGRMRAESPIG